jgi:hypothetical protein
MGGWLWWVLLAQPSWEKTEALRKKLGAIKRDDAKAWLSLAAWCEKSGLAVEAEHAWRRAASIDPENAEARRKLGHVKRGGAWLDRAGQAAAEAEKKRGMTLYGLEWVKPEEAERLRKKERAEVGWEFDRKVQGAHWSIYTDAPEETARKVLAVAEAVYEAFVEDLAGTWPLAGGRGLRAYVFKDRERFMKEANLPTAWAEGYYDGGRRACFCYYDPANSKNPFHWFVHEAEHQLVAEVVAGAPGLNAWLSEGYACYYGTSRMREGRLILGEIDPDTYPTWWRKKYTERLWPLGEFADRIAPRFGEQKDPNPFYLQAWLLVHYLMHGEEGRHRAGFRKFLVEAARGSADTATFEKHVGRFADLQEGFTRYARSISESR